MCCVIPRARVANLLSPRASPPGCSGVQGSQRRRMALRTGACLAGAAPGVWPGLREGEAARAHLCVRATPGGPGRGVHVPRTQDLRTVALVPQGPLRRTGRHSGHAPGSSPSEATGISGTQEPTAPRAPGRVHRICTEMKCKRRGGRETREGQLGKERTPPSQSHTREGMWAPQDGHSCGQGSALGGRPEGRNSRAGQGQVRKTLEPQWPPRWGPGGVRVSRAGGQP